MSTLDDLRQTLVYQEAEQDGLKKAIFRLLSRKVGQIQLDSRGQVEAGECAGFA